MTNAEVLKYFKVADTEHEMRIQRLKMWQKIATDSAYHIERDPSVTRSLRCTPSVGTTSGGCTHEVSLSGSMGTRGGGNRHAPNARPLMKVVAQMRMIRRSHGARSLVVQPSSAHDSTSRNIAAGSSG